MPRGVYIRTPECRAILSAAHQSSSKSIVHLEKVHAALVGRHHTQEAKAKIRAAMMGDKAPAKRPEVRAKLSVALRGNQNALGYRHDMETLKKMRGPNHPRWLGGISREPYAWTFNLELKEEVRRRDGHKCQLCGIPQAECDKALPVHHVDYDKKNSDPVNLVTLCNSCNAKVNANRKHWTVVFQAMAIERSMKEMRSRI